MSSARPWSFSAPATISEADAEPALTSTTSGAPVDQVPGRGVHLEARIGGAAVGGDDDAGVQEVVGHGDAGFEHAAGIVSQVEHEPLDSVGIVALEAQYRPLRRPRRWSR